ncbi:MAG: GNAT family N-acetyltransferase [Nocardioidaceae bacterium]
MDEHDTRLELTPFTDEERSAWLDGAEQRLADEALAMGATSDPDYALRRARQRLQGFEPDDAVRASLTHVLVDGAPVTTLWRVDSVVDGAVSRVGVAEPTRGWGDETALGALIARAVDEARDRGAKRLVWVTYPPDDGLGEALERDGFHRSSTLMRLELPDALPASEVRLSPMSQERFEAFTEFSIADYASEVAASGVMSLEEAEAESRRTYAELLPEGTSTPGNRLLSASVPDVDGEIGILWWAEDGPGLAWIFDIAVGEGHRGRGLGRALLDAGHADMAGAGVRRVVLNVFGHNETATRLYVSSGYVPFLRSFSRDL